MTKFKTLCILTILISLNSNSQITKGFWMMGGNASFTYSKVYPKPNPSGEGITFGENNPGVYSFLLEPKIGYFIYDKLAVGTSINYSNSYIENGGFSEYAQYGFGFYVRYYLLNHEKQINLFLEPSYNYYIPNPSLGGGASSIAFRTGLVVFLNDTVGFETTLTYSNTDDKFSSLNKINLGFGLQIHLEKK